MGVGIYTYVCDWNGERGCHKEKQILTEKLLQDEWKKELISDRTIWIVWIISNDVIYSGNKMESTV